MNLLMRQEWSDLRSELVPTTRHQVRHAVDQLAPFESTERLDDVELIVSELLANAVLYAAAPIELVVSASDACVRIAVTDASPDLLPPPPPQAALAETGRGLMLTALLGDRWGWQVDTTSKTVWVEFDRAPQPAA